MLKIERGNITLTRGDSAFFALSIDNYTPAEGDTMVMTIKENIEDANEVIKKEIAAGTEFMFAPGDTKDLEPKKYVYDVELHINATGEVYTIISTHNFTLVKGVTE